MLDILHFIFSSFWVFAGTVLLLTIVGQVLINLVAVIASIISSSK